LAIQKSCLFNKKDGKKDSMSNNKDELYVEKVRDHMANERTFLSWIRTSVAIMAFGFVVEKFSLFLKQIASMMGNNQQPSNHLIAGHSAYLGLLLVAIGAFICLLAFIKYKKTERQINSENFKQSITIDILLASTIFFIGLFLTMYLLNSI